MMGWLGVTNRDEHSKRRKDLDFLRGLGLVFVVIGHSFPDILPGDFIGVDLFFVISGFLITKKSIEKLKNNQFSVFEYFQNRIKRIIPPALVTLIISFHFFVFFCNPLELRIIIEQVQSCLLFYNNIHTYLVSRYFDGGFLAKPYIHFWSLSLEEQYYFLWPFLVLCLKKLFKFKFLILLGITLISFITSIYLIEESSSAAYLLLPSRIWQILIGGVLALSHYQRYNRIQKSNLIGVIGLSMIIFAVFFCEKHSYPGASALIPTLGTCLFIISGNSKFNQFISRGILVHFGHISYSMYLIHMPILSILFYTHHNEPKYRILFIFIAYILSLFLYYLVEKPTAIMKKPKSIKRINIAVIILSPIFLIYISLFNYDFMYTQSKLIELKIAKIFLNDGFDGHNRFETNLCDENTESEYAIIGDSHAAQYLGAANRYENLHVTLFQHGIIPSASLDYKTNEFDTTFFKNCFKKLLRNPYIKTFIITTRLPIYLSGKKTILENRESYDGSFTFTNEIQTNEEAVRYVLSDLILKSKKFNKNVIIFTPTPVPGEEAGVLRRCLSKHLSNKDCNAQVNLDETRVQNHQTLKILVQLKKDYKNLETFNTTKALCGEKRNCQMINSMLDSLYRDNDHLSNYGAKRVLRSFAHQLQIQESTNIDEQR